MSRSIQPLLSGALDQLMNGKYKPCNESGEGDEVTEDQNEQT
jgi:hypothetical protein